MSLRNLTLFLVLIVSIKTLAVTTADEAKAQRATWQKQREQAAQALVEFKSAYTAQVQALENCAKAKSCNEGNIKTLTAERVKSLAGIDAKAREVADLDRRIVEINRNINIADSEARVNHMIESQGIRLDISQLNNEIADQKLKWTQFENKVDREATGIYMQNKILGLLNSQVMCKATARCLTKEKQVVDKEGLKEIFPQMDSSNVLNGEFYHSRALEQRNLTSPKNGIK
jgi:hypothetical protein